MYPLSKVNETLAKLTGAKGFSKLDANCWFLQIPFAESSRHLTTFITSYGRFCFNKLPLGISSTPEHFQRRMSETLEGQEGVLLRKKALTFVLSSLLITATVLEGIFGEYHSSSAALGQQRPEVTKQRLVCDWSATSEALCDVNHRFARNTEVKFMQGVNTMTVKECRKRPRGRFLHLGAVTTQGWSSQVFHCQGVLCHVDDVLAFASTQQEHVARLHAALAKIQTAGLTLNKEKCEYNKE